MVRRDRTPVASLVRAHNPKTASQDAGVPFPARSRRPLAAEGGRAGS